MRVKSKILCCWLVCYCQLFSKSVADGLTLYKAHVSGLADANATIVFTRRMNDLFDLLNSRHPVDAVRLNGKRNRLIVSIKMQV